MATKRAAIVWKVGLTGAFLLVLAGMGGLLCPEARAQWWVEEYKFKPAEGEKTTQQPAEPAPPPAAPEPQPVVEQPPQPPEPSPVTEPPPEQPVKAEPPAAPPPPAKPRPPRAGAFDRGEWDREGLDTLYWGNLSGVRVSVLNGSGRPSQEGLVTALLNDFHSQTLQRKIGQKVVVVNASRLPSGRTQNSVIYYRPGFMRAAMTVASVIPGKQAVLPMQPGPRTKIGIDLEIQLGRDFP